MRPQHDVMTSERVYRHAANLLQTQLQWVDHGRKCTVKALLLVLFYAASPKSLPVRPLAKRGTGLRSSTLPGVS